MKLTDISYYRLLNQQIEGSGFKDAKDLVQYMGAMQSQDNLMSKWAVGLRVPGANAGTIEDALNKGEILRTHVLRPTWHLVSAKDIWWMLELTAPNIRPLMKSHQKEMELTAEIFSKSNSVLEKMLQNKHRTREDVLKELIQAKIRINENRASHLLMMAELEGLICSGPSENNKQTYALIANVVPERTLLSKDESLATLAERYFISHGPATLQDFTWWSGLSVKDARAGLETVKKELISETINSQIFWFHHSFKIPESKSKSTYLLPAYDEFVISYKDRSAILNIENHKKAVSINGIFKPVILIKGQITGLWKRTIKNETVTIETEFFRPHKKTELEVIEKAAKAYGKFIGYKSEVRFSV